MLLTVASRVHLCRFASSHIRCSQLGAIYRVVTMDSGVIVVNASTALMNVMGRMTVTTAVMKMIAMMVSAGRREGGREKALTLHPKMYGL